MCGEKGDSARSRERNGKLKPEVKRVARPRKEIDQRQFEALLRIGCKRGEIVAFFDSTVEGGCCDDTIDRWCKRTYKGDRGHGLSFAEILDQRKDLQKITVRQAVFQAMKDGSASVIIFAAKNLLGWSDNPQQTVTPEISKDDALSASLRELAEGLESDDQ